MWSARKGARRGCSARCRSNTQEYRCWNTRVCSCCRDWWTCMYMRRSSPTAARVWMWSFWIGWSAMRFRRRRALRIWTMQSAFTAVSWRICAADRIRELAFLPRLTPRLPCCLWTFWTSPDLRPWSAESAWTKTHRTTCANRMPPPPPRRPYAGSMPSPDATMWLQSRLLHRGLSRPAHMSCSARWVRYAGSAARQYSRTFQKTERKLNLYANSARIPASTARLTTASACLGVRAARQSWPTVFFQLRRSLS